MIDVMKRIFVVDDDPQVFKIIKTMLSHAPLDLCHYPNGQACWDALQQQDAPDLIILDIMMPQLSGITLCQRIRETPDLKKIKVLMLSAKDSQKDRLAGLSDGADDYVTKPFHIATLAHKIQYMLYNNDRLAQA
jgi:DNA-binding response OmpR family regulator